MNKACKNFDLTLSFRLNHKISAELLNENINQTSCVVLLLFFLCFRQTAYQVYMDGYETFHSLKTLKEQMNKLKNITSYQRVANSEADAGGSNAATDNAVGNWCYTSVSGKINVCISNDFQPHLQPSDTFTIGNSTSGFQPRCIAPIHLLMQFKHY